MKPIRFDEGHRFDDPNLRWGSPSYRLEPGDPGYVPPPSTPPPKARRRTPSITYTPTTPMLPYQFITRTSTQNQITTSRTSRGTKTTAEVYAEVQTRLGQQALTIPLVLKTALEVILDWTTEGWTVEPIEDLLGFTLPCGGAFEDADFQPTFEAMNHTPSCNWGDAGRARVSGSITYENQGHQGRIVPVIIRIVDNWTGDPDQYTAGKSVCVVLGNKKGKLEFDRTKGCKVQFRKTDNSLVEATDYSLSGNTKINAQVPAGTTGNLTEVIVTMLVNGTLRAGSYTTVLIP